MPKKSPKPPVPKPRGKLGGLRIGISGWTYAPWRGIFFPPGLKQSGELAYASRMVNSIEINGTFYSLQRPTSYAAWHAQTPEGFVFSVKAPRFITHIRRLKEVRIPLANFFASGVLRLQEKLGPFLWQLPPSFPYDAGRLESFFRILPRTTRAAAALAREHDAHVRLGTWLETDRDRPLRHALEVRHPSFKNPEFIALLRAHRIGLVVADTAGKWPALEDVTADFVYVRLHGQSRLYVSGYTPAAIKAWGEKVQAWRRGGSPASPHRLTPAPRPAGRPRDVFVYFDNDVKTHAPYDAMTLAHRLGIGPKVRKPRAAGRVAEEPRNDWPPYGNSTPPVWRGAAISGRPSSSRGKASAPGR
jgi:uncharacterized protein YecE (DUF72 family)